MATIIFESDGASDTASTNCALLKLQEQNQALQEENYYLRQEVGQVEEQVNQLSHELSQKQMLVKVYHKELESFDGKKPTKRGGCRWKSTLNCLKSKAQTLEHEKWELTVELEARKSELENREAKLESLQNSYVKQIETMKKKISQNEVVLRKQEERNEALQTEKEELTEKLTHYAEQFNKVKRDLEARDKEMEELTNREIDFLEQIRDRQQEIDDLRTLYEDRREEAKRLRGTSLNGRPRNGSGNEPTGNLSIKEELEESMRRRSGEFSGNRDINRVLHTVSSANQKFLGNEELPDAFSPVGRRPRSPLFLGRSPTFSVGGDSGWGSDEENSFYSPRTPENNGSRRPRLCSKLLIVKPLEGSETLHQWKRLATPSLGSLFDTRDGIVTREEHGSPRLERVTWHTRDQMLAEPEEDDDPEVQRSFDSALSDPGITTSLHEQISEMSLPPRSTIDDYRQGFNEMRPRSRSLVEMVKTSGLRAFERTGINQKEQYQEPVYSWATSKFGRRCSVASTPGHETVSKGFLQSRSFRSEHCLDGGRANPDTCFFGSNGNGGDSFTGRLVRMISGTFHSEPDLSRKIVCVPETEMATPRESSWKLKLHGSSSAQEGGKKFKIKLVNKKHSETKKTLEKSNSVLSIFTNLRGNNLLTGGFSSVTDLPMSSQHSSSFENIGMDVF